MLKFSLMRQRALPYQPTRPQLAKWLKASLQQAYATVMLSVSIVGEAESQELNLAYRAQDKPTNVISLEFVEEREQFNLLTGELILCDPVVVAEATQQGKSVLAHYAHLVVHGMLHLQGFDHLDDAEAEIMEQLEVNILAKLGFSNPYLENIHESLS